MFEDMLHVEPITAVAVIPSDELIEAFHDPDPERFFTVLARLYPEDVEI